MPRGDGTGPQGQGSQTGRGMGKCGPDGGTPAPQRQGGKGTRRSQGRRSGGGAGRGTGQGGGQGSRKSRGRRQ